MTYQLHRLWTQLDNGTSTAGNDCAVEGIINAAETVSDGRVGPPAETFHDEMVHLIRGIAREPHDGLLLRSQVLKVVRSEQWMHQYDRAGLKRPHVDLLYKVGWGTIIRRVKAGWVILLPVDYGVLNDAEYPSGSLSFGGGHMIVIANGRKGPNGWLYVDVADSLWDGRLRWVGTGIHRRLHRYPKSWQRVRLLELRKAAGKWGEDPAGVGHCYAIALKPRSSR